jgi:hypothetical protein
VSSEEGRDRRGRRRLVVAVVLLTSSAVAAVVIRTAVLRDRAHGIPVDLALDRYRTGTSSTTTTAAAGDPPGRAPEPVPTATVGIEASAGPASTSTTTAPTARPALVAPGVYRYRTVGEESIDALGGATHRYPDETTITVVHDGCGVLLRWDALRERRDEWRLCTTESGTELQPAGVQYHEFFGRADAEDVACDRTVVVIPAVPATAAADPVVQRCTLGDDAWSPAWELVGRSRRPVAGDVVDVVHVRMVVDDDDEYWEHTAVDWYLAEDGLPVEVATSKESRSPSPIGGVVYRETYRLTLASLVPLT